MNQNVTITTTIPPQAPSLAIRPAVDRLLTPLWECAEESASLVASEHPVRLHGADYQIPKFLLLGQRGGGKPIRLGFFAGFEPGQLNSIKVLSQLLLRLEAAPALAQDYALIGYPVVNQRGFDTARAPLTDFARRFAHESLDGDVQFFQNELRRWFFNGLISLRVDTRAAVAYATVRSEVIARQVVEPVLLESRGLPLALHPLRVRPEDRYARLADYGEGRLMPPADLRPYPFEVDLTIPANCGENEVKAFVEVIVSLLRRYRAFLAHGADL